MSSATVLSQYGAPEVLVWSEVEQPTPGPGQIRIQVYAAGLNPTDLKIRRGELPFLGLPAVIGYEVSGVVDAVGPDVTGVEIGQGVAAWLPNLGGYGEYVVTALWSPKPDAVSWVDAAALPASAEAAVRVLRQLNVVSGETLLVLGGGGAVGVILTQLAIAAGAKVISANGAADDQLLRDLGAVPVRYGADLLANVRAVTPAVDAVVDAAGHGGLAEAVELAGGPQRVVTLADGRGAQQYGVLMSTPGPDSSPDGVGTVLELVAAGKLRLRDSVTYPMADIAKAHADLETGGVRQKVVLTLPALTS
ncbi:NADP-dependent oxidoreductase [Kribbella sandramycini]|uniref:NADP-dependent oxidoreductase n=1 Tax=Kribbella sandramycini TaxID=60450 RepID=A0A7Y4L1U8_9ACTN|nr:NADP-dependent oxidoreductase [Kribbella sandramycini]MBB6566587.1 NADPH:quinone reductase-like Zn-dependent oxidoreductase [Kribbella sandramycini]NOL42758.1 NADP-dependent oxidoreductase [Kribbella sandramycini]